MAVLIAYVLLALEGIVFLDVILSWVMPNPEEFPRRFTAAITDPLCAPIRAILSPQMLGGLDISPMLIIFVLEAARGALAQVL